jgi:hypothetical protein
VLRDGLAAVQESDGNVYLAIPLRNVASGLAVIDGWHLGTEKANADTPLPPIEEFRRHSRDLYVPAGDISCWQAAVRDSDDALYAPLRAAIRARTPIYIDILYGDHEGGQHTVTTLLRPTAPTGRRG